MLLVMFFAAKELVRFSLFIVAFEIRPVFRLMVS